MKSLLLALQKTLVGKGANTFDHAVFTSNNNWWRYFVLNLGEPIVVAVVLSY
jgi:hypothetical protein